MSEVMLRVENLKKSFDGRVVLDGIDLQVHQGEVVAVIGPSGTGKSTLLRCIDLLELPDEGSITIGEVAQVKDFLPENRPVQELIAECEAQLGSRGRVLVRPSGTEPLIRVKKMRKEDARQKAREVLKLVGLEDKEDAYPSHLSGGQQQRVGIGRAIATGPKLMLLDEPTSSLDPELVGGVLEGIRKLAARHMTMLLTTHEMDFARSVADRVIFLADGRIQEEGTPAEIFDHPQNPRLQSFLASHFRRELS